MAAQSPTPNMVGPDGQPIVYCHGSPGSGVEGDLSLTRRPWGFDLSTIAVPSHVWHGEHDGNVPVMHGRYLARAIPNCRATFYPDDAHLSVPLNHHREILGALVAACA